VGAVQLLLNARYVRALHARHNGSGVRLVG
jgi:hypothetical protein